VRLFDTDGNDPRMGMRRTHHHAMKRACRRQIGDVAPAPAQEAFVFEAVEAAAEK
jgi:hypothetical protein